VFSLEVGKFPQCLQEPFRHFTAFWAIEITTEFFVVGMALAGVIPSQSLVVKDNADVDLAAHPDQMGLQQPYS
jgi:hypothetical protein